MWHPTEASTGAANAAELLGDVRELALQLGPPPPLTVGGSGRSLALVDSVPALRRLVEYYARETLATREWPVIIQAWELTRLGKVRELIALDQRWRLAARSGQFAEASYRVGRRQLNKLRGLRHERVIARYLAAIEAGKASGWHPIVFGVVLAVYHLPLRSGLVQFAANTITGFVSAAERNARLPAKDCQDILDAEIAALPAKIPALPAPTICGPE